MRRLVLSMLWGSLLGAHLAAVPAVADEGLWLLNQPPVEHIQTEYGLNLEPAWFDHVQKASLRFGRGGSASFVSPLGLIITNHHVARGQVVKLSTPERDLLANGFLATTYADEIRCPDLAVYSLQEIVDVTERVRAAGERGLGVAEADAFRRAEIAAVEKEFTTSLVHSEVVTLYGGGLYHLYRYTRYPDVRLVFVPRPSEASFGGDVDNFEFPRWCLDITLLRAYNERGTPLRPDHFLQVSASGVKEDQPVFVLGHPRTTQRLLTVDHLRFVRDVEYPSDLRQARTREVELGIFASRGKREAALAARRLSGTQNWRKGTGSKLRDLQDAAVFALKVEEEERLRREVAARSDLAREVGDPWTRVSEAVETYREIFDEHEVLEHARLRWVFGGSDLFRFARIIVRLVEEREKPDADRLTEYRDSNLGELERQLYSPAPVPTELELNILESRIGLAVEILGGEHPLMEDLLDGMRPRERARQLVEGTRLADVSARRALVEGGLEAVVASDDAMIRFARALEPRARAVRKVYEDEVQAVFRDAYARLATARFAVYGDAVYPDATASLRLSTGRVKGFDLEGTPVGPFTDFAGLYRRYLERGPHAPFDLTERWVAAHDGLRLDTPFNLTSTNDIIGGSSGSPMVNADGRFVGIIFDGNRYGFVWDFVYTSERARAVSVDARGILEALREVYGANRLVNEMLGL